MKKDSGKITKKTGQLDISHITLPSITFSGKEATVVSTTVKVAENVSEWKQKCINMEAELAREREANQILKQELDARKERYRSYSAKAVSCQ